MPAIRGIVTAALMFPGGVAAAQCTPEWMAGPPQPFWSLTPTINAITRYQGDFYIGGIGPGDSWGLFMRWDGLGWTWMQALSGITVDSINAFQEFQGDLYIGGWLSFGGGWGLARWDGSKASAVGGGVGGGSLPMPFVMLKSSNSLLVGGRFQTAGGIKVNNIARWDGTQWHAMGAGLGGLEFPYVYGLAEHKGSIYASTYGTTGGPGNTGVARWNGAVWESLELPYPATERTWKTRLASFNGELFLAAEFAKVAPPFDPVVRTFQHNGARWVQHAQVAVGGQARDLVVIDGELLLIATKLAGAANNNLCRWTGTEWEAFEGGTNGYASAITPLGEGFVLAGNAEVAPGSVPFARWGCFCKPDCDANVQLDIRDFICFQALFAIGDERSDCDGDSTLTVADFVCFQAAYAIGC